MLLSFFVFTLICVLCIGLSFLFLKKEQRLLTLCVACPTVLCFGLSLYLGYFLAFGSVHDKHLVVNESAIYSRHVFESRAVVHVLKLDMKSYRLALSGPNPADSDGEISAMKTTSAIAKYEASFATNASFFSPFKDKHLFDYFPKEGERVRTIGYSFDGRNIYGKKAKKWPKLIVLNTGQVLISDDGEMSLDAISARKEEISLTLSGRSVLLKHNEISVSELDDRAYPRTVLGFDSNRGLLWLIVVDGKQPGYSAGLTLYDLAVFMKALGVSEALELDGGGSATMVWRNDKGKVKLLNRPIHTKIPFRERPVANHLLLYERKG